MLCEVSGEATAVFILRVAIGEFVPGDGEELEGAEVVGEVDGVVAVVADGEFAELSEGPVFPIDVGGGEGGGEGVEFDVDLVFDVGTLEAATVSGASEGADEVAGLDVLAGFDAHRI